METTTAHFTFVFIPGAGGDTWFWHRVVPLLEADGHEAIPVELPAGDESAGIPEYVDVVLAAIGAASHDVILVAQSLGGFTAVAAAARAEVAQLVFVNAMIPAPGETAGEWWANTKQGDAMRALTIEEGRDPDQEFDTLDTFFHDLPADVIAEALAAPEPEQTETPFGSPSMLETWPDVSTKVIVGRDDRLFPATFQTAVSQGRLGITPDVVPGGHCLALSQPEALVGQLKQYASELEVHHVQAD